MAHHGTLQRGLPALFNARRAMQARRRHSQITHQPHVTISCGCCSPPSIIVVPAGDVSCKFFSLSPRGHVVSGSRQHGVALLGLAPVTISPPACHLMLRGADRQQRQQEVASFNALNGCRFARLRLASLQWRQNRR
jgi:hypothetical protein